MVALSGGDKLEAALLEIAKKVGEKAELRVGFLEGATYPDGTPVAKIAAIQEFGGRVEREPSEVTIYRQIDSAGNFKKNGRFVSKDKSNFASDHYVGAYVINIPARPFFRTMIKAKSPEWGKSLGEILKSKNFEAGDSLALMGEGIKGQLQESIRDFNDPPNAPATVRSKGFDTPLIDTGHMLNSVGSEVTKG